MPGLTNSNLKMITENNQSERSRSLKLIFFSLGKFISEQLTVVCDYAGQAIVRWLAIVYGYNIHVRSKQDNRNVDKMVFQ